MRIRAFLGFHLAWLLADAARCALPGNGAAARRVEGLITLRQEDRFRLEDDEGVGYLFTLRGGFRTSARDLDRWASSGTRVAVRYRGVPDMGAVAEDVRPLPGK